MAQFDLPIDQLESYCPEREEPADFDAFWHDTLADARQHGTARFDEVGSPLRSLIVEDVTFPGFSGHPVHGWMLRPRNEAVRGCVVQFTGYGGGRGHPEQWTLLPAAGYALLVMDTRGQGNGGSPGATSDPVGNGPQVPGRLTAGIEDPSSYYYRRVFTDAACAVDAARTHAAVDPERVVVAGGSQGGGIALAAAGLSRELAGAMIDVPFLSHFRRALRVTDASPYSELARYLQSQRGNEEAVFRTLSYFDGVNFAARASVPALFSVGLYDTVCPPSTVYAAFNAYASDMKHMAVYPYNGHEGGQWHHTTRQLAFLEEVLG